MEIRYSIIIPHYNMPNLLSRLVSSIPNRDDIQVIIVDDKSPNASEYKSKYEFLNRTNVEFYLSNNNGGGGAARNKGLTHAKGKWVLFADSDDFFNLDFDKFLDEYYYSDVDVIYFNIDSVESDDISKKSARSDSKYTLFDEYSETHDENIFRLQYPEPWGKMIRRVFIESNHIKFDETRVANDFFFSIQVGCLAKKIGIVNKKIYTLVNRIGSVSHNYADTLEKLNIRLEVSERVELFLDKHGYQMTPSPLRGLCVLLLKRSPSLFFKEISKLRKDGVHTLKLLTQIFNPKYFKK